MSLDASELTRLALSQLWQVTVGLACRPAAYARCLLDVLESRQRMRPLASFPGVRAADVTASRLEHIMQTSPAFHHRTPRWSWAVIFLAALLVLPGAAPADPPEPAGDGTPQVTPAQAEQAADDTEGVPAADEVAPAAAGGPPRYRFAAGTTYIYDVSLSATLPDGRETWSGHVYYEVKAADGDGQMTLSNWANLVRHSERTAPPTGFPPRMARPPMGPRAAMSGPNYSLRREFVINATGAVVRYHGATRSQRPMAAEGDAQLPFLLGELGRLLLDRLPQEGETTWTTENQVNITGRTAQSPVPFLASERQVHRPAQERVRYTLREPAAEAVAIAKEYVLATDETVDGKPALEQTGSGELTFDLGRGVPQALRMEYTIVIREPQVVVTVPVTVSAALLDEEQARQLLAERQAPLSPAEARELIEERQAAFAAARARQEEVLAAAAAEPEPLSDDEIDRALGDIAGRALGRPQAAAQRLAQSEPIDARREEVLAAVRPLMSDSSGFVAREAVKAVGVWGTDDDLPALIALLQDRNVFTRRAAIEALGNYAHPRAAEAVAQELVPMQSRGQAGDALRAMGPVAEAAVLPLTDHRDWGVQLEALKVLAAVGTEASLEPLQELTVRPQNRLVERELRNTLTAIEARIGSEKNGE